MKLIRLILPGKRPWPAVCLLCAAAVLGALALGWQPVLPLAGSVGSILPQRTILQSIGNIAATGLLAAALYLLYDHAYLRLARPVRLPELLLSLCYALLSLTARSFNRYDSLAGLLGTGAQAALSLLMLLFLTVFYCAVVHEVFSWIDRRLAQKSAAPPRGLFAGSPPGRSLLLSFLIIFAGWVPYLMAFYPGSMEWDYLVQVSTYDGLFLWNDMHPPFSTWLMGSRLDIGRQLGSDNLGAFLYILLQSAALAFSFAYTVRAAARWHVGKPLGYALLAFYALFPLWGFMAQFGIKDIMYTAVLTGFAALIWEFVLGDDRLRKSNSRFLAMAAAGLLACFLRNNGALIVVPSILFLLLLKMPASLKLRAAAMAASVLLLYASWLYGVLPALGIPGAGIRDAMSIPFQQTARYIRDHGEEVTGDEREAISAVLEYDKLGSLYMSNRSDLVKGTLRPGVTEAQVREYLRAWLSMLGKRPLLSLESVISNSYAYYCPEGTVPFLPLCEFSTEIEKNPAVYLGNVDLNQPEELAGLRETLKGLYAAVKSTPVVSLLVNQGFYSYLLFGLFALLSAKPRRWLLPGLLPMLFVLLHCIASPVNGMLRYFFPVMACMPISLMAVRTGLVSNTQSKEL